MSDPITRLNAALEGSYAIQRELGQGGMATVYLADDLKHERKVALKVLKPELAAVVGAERFLAEIKTTANLQHPHILPLHDSGEADGFLFYVMPYIEGETLRDRLEREKQLPVEEAVRIATDVAEALYTAHEQGVIHRDIKPANILMSRGRPLVADFGIALAVSAAGGGRLTETGLSMGTPYYMSPEQASADREANAASDVYSLGCVLYEMLVGEPPHTGGSAQAVLAKILMDDVPAPTRTRASIPANVDAAIRKALEKLPADRFTDAQGFAAALADSGFRHGALPVGMAGGRGQLTPLAMAASGLAVLFASVAGWALLRTQPEPVRHVERFGDPFLSGQEHSAYSGTAGSDLSPDGTILVYRFNDPSLGSQVLMMRRWDELVATPVRATTGAGNPAVSFDGSDLAFQANGEVRVLSFDGGPVRTLLTGEAPEWGPDGYVYATVDSGTVRIPSVGGAQEIVSRLGEGEIRHFVDDVLPDGDRLLLQVDLVDGSSEMRGLDLASGETTVLTYGSLPRYATTGHLVFLFEGAIMAARFDPGRMELLGQPVAVLDGVNYFSLADDGKLYYTVGTAGQGDAGPRLQLAWGTNGGTPTPVDPSWTFDRGADPWQSWRLSPDGSMIALREFTGSGYDIWIKYLEGGRHSRLTLSDAHEKTPIWSPDGLRVTYLSDRNGNFDVWERSVDGLGQAELILDLEEDLRDVAWSPDGEWLVLQTVGPDGDILAYRPGVDTEPTPLFATRSSERNPSISQDGRWIAYSSDETGQPEVWVNTFPDVAGGKWLVSLNGGNHPTWARSGRSLMFDSEGQGQPMMVADFTGGAAFVSETPRVFEGSGSGWFGSAETSAIYDVTLDDERVLIGVNPDGAGAATVDGAPAASRVLINNFFEELRRLVPQ